MEQGRLPPLHLKFISTWSAACIFVEYFKDYLNSFRVVSQNDVFQRGGRHYNRENWGVRRREKRGGRGREKKTVREGKNRKKISRLTEKGGKRPGVGRQVWVGLLFPPVQPSSTVACLFKYWRASRSHTKADPKHIPFGDVLSSFWKILLVFPYILLPNLGTSSWCRKDQ